MEAAGLAGCQCKKLLCFLAVLCSSLPGFHFFVFFFVVFILSNCLEGFEFEGCLLRGCFVC